MASTPIFDDANGHRLFSATCFNRVWEGLEAKQRTPEEDEILIACCLASLWHWSQRPDCTRRNLSIGYWQASRVYAVLGQAENSLRYGELCLQISAGQEPFYLGYAYEALARASALVGDESLRQKYVNCAMELAAEVPHDEEREALLNDLADLRSVRS